MIDASTPDSRQPGLEPQEFELRQAEAVTVPASSGPLPGYYASPEAEGARPGVVVIHEAYGLNDNIREVARRFAGQGYAALAVDLFRGRNRVLCMARFLAGMLVNSLDYPPIRDLKAALTYLGRQPDVDSGRLGAIGFCLGGSLAIAWACTDDRLKVVAPFYSMNPRPAEALARACPVVGSFPADDFTAAGGRKLKELLDTHDIPNDIKIYPNARHSFFNDQGGNYDPAASLDAWQRTLAFFDQHLGK
jgi:carboxymethylenebutenolidase